MVPDVNILVKDISRELPVISMAAVLSPKLFESSKVRGPFNSTWANDVDDAFIISSMLVSSFELIDILTISIPSGAPSIY